MASSNQQLQDSAFRHTLDVIRYGNGVEAEIVKLLSSVDRDLVSKIAARLAGVEGGQNLSPRATARLEALLTEIRSLNDDVYKAGYDKLVERLEAFAEAEGDYHTRGLQRVVSGIGVRAPSPVKLRSIVTQRPIFGQLLEPFVKTVGERRMLKVEEAIRIGMAEGQGIDGITRRIVGTKAKNYTDGLLDKTRASARSMVRTSVNHVANHAAQVTWETNSDIIKGWQFVATLDSRVSLICASLDGEIFKVGEGPVPPRHPSCRSITIAVTKSYREMGIDADEITPEFRASMDGQVAGSKNLESWLREQPEGRQNAVLGASRAKLFRSGERSLKDLVDDTGQVIPLSELQRLNRVGGTAPLAQPARKAFTSPIDRSITDATVPVISRLAAQKQLTASVREAAQDSRYNAKPEFKGVTASQFGKAGLPATFTDEAASMLAALNPELEALADAFKVPRLRGYKAIGDRSKASANMGDGVLGVHPSHFNAYAARVGNKADGAFLKEIESRRAALRKELDDIKAELESVRKARSAMTRVDDEYADLYLKERQLIDQYNAKVKPLNTLAKQASISRAASASKWKIGDDAKDRPYCVQQYFEGIDKARSLLYHEFAHHAHQMTGKVGVRTRNNIPPVELELEDLYRRKFNGGDRAANMARLPTKYAGTNSHEWFAENFALYMMGRTDLVDPDLEALIRRLLDGTD